MLFVIRYKRKYRNAIVELYILIFGIAGVVKRSRILNQPLLFPVSQAKKKKNLRDLVSFYTIT